MVHLQNFPPTPQDEKRIQGYDRDQRYFENDLRTPLIRNPDRNKNLFRDVRDISGTAKTKYPYLALPYGRMISEASADLMFGNPALYLSQAGAEHQKNVNRIVVSQNFDVLNYETALTASAKGGSVWKLRWGLHPIEVFLGMTQQDEEEKSHLIAEEVQPEFFFPEFGLDQLRPVQYNLGFVSPDPTNNSNNILTWETYIPERDSVKLVTRMYSMRKGSREVGELVGETIEDTRINEIPLVYIPNKRAGGNYWGVSDYADMWDLFEAINMAWTRYLEVVAKHSDPMIAVPAGFLDAVGEATSNTNNMGAQETSSETTKLVEVEEGQEAPSYIVWDAKLEAAINGIRTLEKYIFQFTKISPSTFGFDSRGGQEISGRAVKLKMLALLALVKRKQRYFEQADRDRLRIAQKLELAWGREDYDIEDVDVVFGDPIPLDDQERLNETLELLRNNLISNETAMRRQRIPDISGEQDAILEEQRRGLRNFPDRRRTGEDDMKTQVENQDDTSRGGV